MIRRMCDILLSAIVAGVLYTACADPAAAQNVTCATRPAGDKTNACASTAFVNGTSNPQNLNTIRFASQYGQADWCANLNAALTDIGAGITGTIIIDSNQTITACSAGSTINIGTNKQIKFVSGDIFTLNQTLQIGIGSSIIGTGGGPTYSGNAVTGTTLKWTGAASGDMILFMNALHARVADISVNCNSVSDCAGIHYDSTNTNLTSQNIIENVTMTGGHYGLLIGNRGTTHPTVAQCNATPAQSGCYEMDFLTLRNFQIFGTCTDLTAEGIHVNSYFALQQSVIERGNIQCANIGIRNVFSAGQNTIVREVVGGSVVGVNPVFFQTDSGGAQGYNFINNENEGVWTYSLHDSGCSGSGTSFQLLESNSWAGGPVLLDGCQTVTSIGNSFANGTWTAATGVTVASVNDVQTWTSTGGVITYLPTPSSPLSTAAGGLGANNSASNGVPLFAAGVVTMTGTSGTGNFARVTSPTFGGSPVVSSNSATAMTVGPNGTTNPVWQIDASTASQASGLKLTGGAAGAAPALQVTDSAAATSLTINAKSTGVVFLGNSSSGGVQLASGGGGVTIGSALTYGGVTLSNAVTGTGNMVLSASPTLTGTLTAAAITNTGVQTNSNATASSSSSTGALTVAGGVGVGGVIYSGTGLGIGSGASIGGSVVLDVNATSPIARIVGNSNTDQITLTWQHAIAASDQTWQMAMLGGASGGFSSKDWVLRDGGLNVYLGVTSGGVVKMPASTAATSATTGGVVMGGGLGVAGAIWAGTYIDVTPTVVNSLPSCVAGLDGARAFVTNNATATAFAGAVTTGGANHHPVYCDGGATAWKQG